MSKQVHQFGHNTHVELLDFLLSIAVYSATAVHQYAHGSLRTHSVQSFAFFQNVHEKTVMEMKPVVIWL